jgi:uncharacterized protein (TIGR02266 family)
VKPSNPSPSPNVDRLPRQPRAELKVEVGIDDSMDFYVGFVENVSPGGIFVSTYRLLPIGSEIALTFVLPDQSTLFVHGVVRWLRDPADRVESEVSPGMGVQFTDLGDIDSKRLHAYVTRQPPGAGPNAGPPPR